MGGAAPVESGKGKRKPLDLELNLVPFIDLLSCLISFLLITAVWTQVSALRVLQQEARQTSDAHTEPPPDNLDVRLTLTDRGYLLAVASVVGELPKVGGTAGPALDTKTLVEKLKALKQQFPEHRAVTVAAEDAVSFEDLTTTIDSINSADLPDVTVSAAID